MALNPCVKQILCALGQATLNALNTLIVAQIARIDAQIAVFKAQILALDVLILPLQAVKSIAEAAVQAARQSLGLVPLSLIAGCVDLGDFNINLVQTLEDKNAELQDTLTDINRKISIREDLNALVAELDAIREQFADIRVTIAECLTP